MMDLLNEVVRNLVILVIIMTFMEMLLPDNKLKKTASLIFGLMIIATLLNPIVVILNSLGRSSFDLSEFTFAETITYGDDEEIQAAFNKMTLNQYLENISDTIGELVAPHTEGYDVEVEVIVVEDFTSKDFGKLNQINIFLEPKYEGIKPIQPIKPVVIGEQYDNDKYVEYEDGHHIRKVVKDYFQISESIVNVLIQREEG